MRDVYDLGETILLVATDRLSAYDHVLSPGIPGQGQDPHPARQLLVLPPRRDRSAPSAGDRRPTLPRRSQAPRGAAARAVGAGAQDARRALECVARGYLGGQRLREYRDSGTACGIALPPGLERASLLPSPIFTPATKAESGHDENISFETLRRASATPSPDARDLTLALYRAGADHAAERGLLLADTKFEFGQVGDELLLIDEALTPDSSRYWEAASWRPGQEPASFDKQYVRDWLDASRLGSRIQAAAELPADVVRGTLDRYVEAFRRLTGREPEL